jgi:hypothetical protein
MRSPRKGARPGAHWPSRRQCPDTNVSAFCVLRPSNPPLTPRTITLACRGSHLVVQHTQERSCWVALPPALCSRLFQTRATLPLALELRPVRQRAGVALPSDTPLYAAWAGSTAAAGCVGVPAALARALGLAEGSRVALRAMPEAPQAVSVTVEPASEDDWEVVQLNAEYLEEQLLNQVRRGSGRGLGGSEVG